MSPALRALDDAQAGTLTQGGPLGASVPCAEWWEVRFGGQISMVNLRARDERVLYLTGHDVGDNPVDRASGAPAA